MTELPGVTFLDHTADVGIAVQAASREELFHRAALGMLALLLGEADEDSYSDSYSYSYSYSDSYSDSISISGQGEGEVLLGWLRELLFLHETKGLDYVEADFHRLDATGLDATVRVRPAAGAVREIKGVTYHELSVEPTDHGWKGRVIFDV